MPDVRSIGNILSLHSAMALDESGVLKNLVIDFAKETSIEGRERILDKILFHLADADNIAPDSRGSSMDARKLKVIERMMGTDFIGVNGRNPNSNAGPILNSVYDSLFENYYNQMNIQTHLSMYSSLIYVVEEGGKKIVNTELFNYMMRMQDMAGADIGETVSEAGRYVYYLCRDAGMEGFDDFYKFYSSYDNKLLDKIDVNLVGVICGSEGDNSIYGTVRADVIAGLKGADQLHGGDGDDVLNGGAGNDIIDNYDTGAERKKDRLVYGEGIRAEDMEAYRDGNYLKLRNRKTGQETKIENAYAYADGRYFLENVEFGDGTVWGLEELREMTRRYQGTEGNDTLNGHGKSYGHDASETFHAGAGNDTVNAGDGDDTVYGESGNDTVYAGAGNDVVYGGEGNDRLYGEAGDDILDGGEGDDYLYGGTGNDTYLFGIGYGKDVISDNAGNNIIQFLNGILAGDITVSAETGRGLTLSLNNTEDKIILSNYYSNDSYKNYKLTFADGTEAAIDGDNTKLVWEEKETQPAMEELPVSEELPVMEELPVAVEPVVIEKLPVSEEPPVIEEALAEPVPSANMESSVNYDAAIDNGAEILGQLIGGDNRPDALTDVETAADAGSLILDASAESENTGQALNNAGLPEESPIEPAEPDIMQAAAAEEKAAVIGEVYSENSAEGYTADELTDIQVSQVVETMVSCSQEGNVIAGDFSPNTGEASADTPELWAANQ